jgi:hypothetical protein
LHGKNTRRLAGKSNQLFAALLLHLAEVEAHGLHRKRSYASLYTYCIYELRFSEDAAARSSAARVVKQLPPLFDAIANGELHLTGLLMLDRKCWVAPSFGSATCARRTEHLTKAARA